MVRKEFTGNASDFLKLAVAAAGRGDLDIVRWVLDEKPGWLHRIGSHGRTMLWEAVNRNKREMVEFLVAKGADVNAVGCHFSQHYVEVSPYCIAKSAGREELAEYLLAQGATIDIYSAAYLGDVELVGGFLDQDPSLVNKHHSYTASEAEPLATPIFYAVSGSRHPRQHLEVIQLLISRGAEIEPYSRQLIGIADDRIEVVKLLLEGGADASKIRLGPPPESEKLAQLLAEHGAQYDVNALHNGWPPIVYVSRGDRGEHPEKVQRLLDLGADVNIRDYKGKTALHRAATAGFLNVMGVLLAHGAEVNTQDEIGDTALHDAIRAKRVESVKLLLLSGADTQLANAKGITPILAAEQARGDRINEVRELLQT